MGAVRRVLTGLCALSAACRFGFDPADELSRGSGGTDANTDPCDQDGDGVASIACGGADCDDSPAACGGACYPGAVELCDGYDNDCDAATVDGSNDPAIAVPCDGLDLDFCKEGVSTCNAGVIACDDTTGTLAEACGNMIDDNCNGQTDEGCSTVCSPNTNPACVGMALGGVKGDEGADQLLVSGADEAWYQVTISEKSWSSINLNAEIKLYNGPGADFDLYVYCASCGGVLLTSSTMANPGGVESISLGKRDDGGVNDSFDVIVEIRYRSHTTCGGWTLEVLGNSGGGNKSC